HEMIAPLEWRGPMSLLRGFRFRCLGRTTDAASAEDRLDFGGAVAELAQDIRPVLADVRGVLLRLVFGGTRQARDVGDRQAADAVLVDPVDRARFIHVWVLEIV